MSNKITCIACSIFQKEIESKLDDLKELSFDYVDSMLHMNPKQLHEILESKINKYIDDEIIIVFGDCHARMVDHLKNKNAYRTKGINCCEIILGSDKYRRLRKEGAFMLMNEWVWRWKEVFQVELGFATKESATMFMQEMHTKLVYLDSQLTEVPYSILEDISDYLGLPYEIEKCSALELKNNLHEIISRIKDDRR